MQSPYDVTGPRPGAPVVPTRQAEFLHPVTHRWLPLAGEVDPDRPETWRDGSTIGWSVYLCDRGWSSLVPAPAPAPASRRTVSVLDWTVLSTGLLILFTVVVLVSGQVGLAGPPDGPAQPPAAVSQDDGDAGRDGAATQVTD